MQRLTLIPVEPVGITDPRLVFYDGPGVHGAAMERAPVYPTTANHKTLKRMRMNRKAVIRTAAEALGLTAGDYCRLEGGRYTLSEAEWAEVLDVVRGIEFMEVP